ncbi:hypothetical protein VTJ04DRAFT_5800 [Mycothermus thermophilus]|uniref:uncharacterized protein n=1 Tax=Humicola insolens TaxID=85995 RepID=UPI003744B016
MLAPELAAAMLYPMLEPLDKGSGPIIPAPTHYHLIGETGKHTLWAGFILMTITAGTFSLLSYNVPLSKRIYHVLATLTAIISALAYFAAATGQTSSLVCHPIRDSHHNHGDTPVETWHDSCRQVFWARYLDWFLTTPLVLINLCLLGGISGAHTLAAVAANAVVIIASWAAAYGTAAGRGASEKETDSLRKTAIWGWFTIGVLAYLVVVWHVGLNGARSVRHKGARLVTVWSTLAGYVLAVWAAYVVVWAVAPIAQKTTVDGEIISYLVLDVLAKAVFGLWLLVTNRSIPESNIDLTGYWSQGLSAEGLIRLPEEE